MIGKLTKSYRKQDSQNQTNLAIGFKSLVFAHKATIGDTSIDLTALSTPSELTGFTNPSSSEIVAAQLLFYKNNLKLTRSAGGLMIPYQEYQVVSSSRINLTNAALDGEIFYGVVDFSAKTGVLGVDARVIRATGTLAASATDINVGAEFKTNAYSSSQIGEVLLYIDGILQMRNVNNVTAAPSADGNYEEVSLGTGYSSVLRMNQSVAYSRSYVVVSAVAIVQRPDGSRDAVLESLQATSGGGGGGSLQWLEDGGSPIQNTDSHILVYKYQAGTTQNLYATIKIPSTYTAGNQITLRLLAYSPDSSGTLQMRTQSTLIRAGVDSILSTANQRTSTNAVITLSAGTVNIPQAITFDLTSSSGQINSIGVSAGDLIKIDLYRATDTSINDVSIPVYGAEVKFS